MREMGKGGTSGFGELLRRYRTAAALSQEELAERAGLSARGVSDLERGARTAPRLETVRLLADALGLNVHERAALIAARGAPLDEAAPVHRRPAARLPVPLASLVGRERETATVAALLRHPDVRLLTLTGPGGVGKTRLATHVASHLAEEFARGAAFVALAPITDPAFVAPAIAKALGVPIGGGQEPVDALTAFFGDRPYVLVLDNFEQILVAAPLVGGLLDACPGLKVLVTSREVLHLYGEQAYLVPPLALPDLAHLPALDVLSQVEAVRLFADRARSAHADFSLSAENASDVAAICARLDGLPLALELAAARVAHLPPPALLARLERRLHMLTGGPRNLPTRLQTMRDAIAWSYDLLHPSEQRLFRRVAVFVGGFDLEAAEVIGGIGNEAEVDSASSGVSVLDGIASLASKSLIRLLDVAQQRPGGGTAPPRFGMLETIREFGLEQLAASGEEADVRGAHVAHFLTLALHARAAWFGAEQGSWFERLDAEHDNLRAALSWAIARDDAVAAQRLAGALWIFWMLRGNFAEGRAWLDRALALDPRTPLAARIDATFGAGQLARHQGDVRRALKLAEGALAEPEAADDPFARALAHFLLGNVRGDLGDREREESLYLEALPLFRDNGEDGWAGRTLGKLGAVAWLRGDLDGYEHHSEERLRLHRASGDAWGVADSLSSLAEVARLRGDTARALALRRESLGYYVDFGNRLGILETLRGIAAIAAASHRPALAARLFGAEDAVRRVDGIVLAAELQDRYAACVATVEAAMDRDAFVATWRDGAALSLQEAMTEALAFEPLDPANPVPTDDPAARFGLTRREREVLRLLAQRWTDREIAGALSISPKTATHHTASVLGKLGLASRREVPAFAVSHGLRDLTTEQDTV